MLPWCGVKIQGDSENPGGAIGDSANRSKELSTAKVLEGFRVAGRVHPALLVGFFLINAIVLINALLHPPTVGYDARAHLGYAEALSAGHLVTPRESREFFCPPVPYLFPAVLMKFLSLSTTQAGKGAQLLNVLLSLGTTLFLLRTCELISPGELPLKLGALAFLGSLPVYYKSFAFVRGEPFVAFFGSAAAYYALVLFGRRSTSVWHAILLGSTLGLAGLSRQWGLLLTPGLAIAAGVSVLKARQGRRMLLTLAMGSLAISLLLNSWFYLILRSRYGSITAFNQAPQERFAFTNQPMSFYCGIGASHLFKDPIRNAFPNQLLPIFYSETWGDYWGYFVVYGKDARAGQWLNGLAWSRALGLGQPPAWLVTNRDSIAPFLGRVNLVSLFPSVLALAGWLTGVRDIGRWMRRRESAFEWSATSLLTLLIVISYLGYFWFLIMYPSPATGNTIKATYMLHTFPFGAVLVGVLLRRLYQKWLVLYQGVMLCLAIVFAHNFPVLFTRFT